MFNNLNRFLSAHSSNLLTHGVVNNNDWDRTWSDSAEENVHGNLITLTFYISQCIDEDNRGAESPFLECGYTFEIENEDNGIEKGCFDCTPLRGERPPSPSEILNAIIPINCTLTLCPKRRLWLDAFIESTYTPWAQVEAFNDSLPLTYSDEDKAFALSPAIAGRLFLTQVSKRMVEGVYFSKSNTLAVIEWINLHWQDMMCAQALSDGRIGVRGLGCPLVEIDPDQFIFYDCQRGRMAQSANISDVTLIQR